MGLPRANFVWRDWFSNVMRGQAQYTKGEQWMLYTLTAVTPSTPSTLSPIIFLHVNWWDTDSIRGLYSGLPNSRVIISGTNHSGSLQCGQYYLTIISNLDEGMESSLSMFAGKESWIEQTIRGRAELLFRGALTVWRNE